MIKYTCIGWGETRFADCEQCDSYNECHDEWYHRGWGKRYIKERIKILKDETFKKWMKDYPYIATFMKETANTLIVNVELHKYNWVCENCGDNFDEPEWLETPTSENPICPKCESLNIDLNKSVVEHKKKL